MTDSATEALVFVGQNPVHRHHRSPAVAQAMELLAADIRCDRCQRPAVTVQWLPWIVPADRVAFACRRHGHDLEGYWLDLARARVDYWLVDHLREKRGNPLGLLIRRLAP